MDDFQKKKNNKKILSIGKECISKAVAGLYVKIEFFVFLIITAEQCGAEEICLNSHDPKSLAAGLSDSVKLSRFFDKVIEKKFYTRDIGGFLEKRKYTSPVTSPYLMSGYGYGFDERSDNK